MEARTIAYGRGLSFREKGGRSSAPAVSTESALFRLLRAIRLSPWMPVVGKAIVGILALVTLAALGRNALLHPAHAALPPSAPESRDPPLQPSSQEALPAAAPSPDASDPSPIADNEKPRSAILPDGRIVLNLASETELTKLPGVGPKRAQAILALRQRLGRFRRVEDLLRVKGIGKKMLTRIRPAVVVDAPD